MSLLIVLSIWREILKPIIMRINFNIRFSFYFISFLFVFYGFQSMRLKLISNNTPMERRFNPWIGGSILASLVSLHLFRLKSMFWYLSV